MKEKEYKYLNDIVITKLLRDEELKEYVKRIIKAALKIEVEDILLVNSKVSSNVRRKDGETDSVYEDKEAYYNIEINYCNYKALEAKNMSYMCHLYLKGIDKNKKYKPKKIYQININNYDVYKKGRFIYESVMMEKRYHIERNEYQKIIDIDITKLQEMDYKEIKGKRKNSLERLLYILVNDNKKEIEEVYREDEIMKKVNKKLITLTEEFDERLYYDREELYRIGAYNEGEEVGLKKGEEIGIKKGKKEGIIEGVIKVAKKLLKTGMSHQEISKVTGLSIKEIEELL